MDAVSIARIFESRDVIAMVVLAGIAAVPVTKGVFAVVAGRHQRRKEFLEFWKEVKLRESDLWLEEIVQHRYGGGIPARLIRHVELLDRPSLKLRKVAMAAAFFDLDQASQQVIWLRRWRDRTAWFVFEVAVCLFGYLLLASLGVILVLTSRRQTLPDGIPLAISGAVLFFMACATFWHLVSLAEARSTLALVNGSARPGFWKAIKRCGSKIWYLFSCGRKLLVRSKFLQRSFWVAQDGQRQRVE